MNFNKKKGSALVMVLWVIGLLSLMVSTFTFNAHIEGRIISYYRKRLKAEALAQSGIELAKLLMMRSNQIGRQSTTDGELEGEWWFSHARRLGSGLNIEGLKHYLGEGVITLDLAPEPAKRNINSIGGSDIDISENLERIFMVGGVPEELWPVLIDSFLDWRDPDNQSRNDGAESEDYYENLTPPYKAKNGLIDDINELLDIRGFNKTILNGGVLKLDGEEEVTIKGIGHLLTTYGDGKVNVNAATMDVLMTLPNVDEIVAGAIIEEREAFEGEGKKEYTSFRNENDVFARIPDLDAGLISYINTGSTIYNLKSTGIVGGVTKRITAIVSFSKGKMTVLRWREDG